MKTIIQPLFFLFILLLSCSSKNDMITLYSSSKEVTSEEFRKYWYLGKGEVNHYELEQARYGEIRTGSAVLVFVTEDFIIGKQVKKEHESNEPYTSILKMNFIKKFVTGIYDYSLMSSVYTPVDRVKFPNSLKVSNSDQDWCGQTFFQLNLAGDNYKVEQHSSFELEGDTVYAISKTWLEDELWNQIRLDPARLPVGNISIIPGTMQARLRHRKLVQEQATSKIESYTTKEFSGKDLKKYTLKYPSTRTLEIIFENTFPFQIIGWKDTYNDFGNILTTKAVLTKTIFTDYWNKHSNADKELRTELGF